MRIFAFGCFCLLAIGLNWSAEQTDKKARYDRCLPEPGQRTVSWWENGKMQCQIEQAKGVPSPRRAFYSSGGDEK